MSTNDVVLTHLISPARYTLKPAPICFETTNTIDSLPPLARLSAWRNDIRHTILFCLYLMLKLFVGFGLIFRFVSS